MSHIQHVKDMYAAFARGDVAAILEKLADDVQWEYGVNSTDVPWLQPRRGRAQVAAFFETLAALEIAKFQPKTFLQSGNIVVSLVDLDAKVTANGRKIVEEDEVHVWYFDSRGKVARFRHRLDTHQHHVAYDG